MPTPRPGVTRPDQHSQEYVTLREYIDFRFKTVEEATAMARLLMEKRLDAMDAAEFATKKEVSKTTTFLADDIRVLQRYQATMEGKASQSSVYIGYALSIIAFVLSAIGLAVKFIP